MPAQNKLYFCQTIDKNEGFPCPFFHICCTFFMPPSKMTFFNPTNRENSFQKFCNFVGFKPWKKKKFFFSFENWNLLCNLQANIPRKYQNELNNHQSYFAIDKHTVSRNGKKEIQRCQTIFKTRNTSSATIIEFRTGIVRVNAQNIHFISSIYM